MTSLKIRLMHPEPSTPIISGRATERQQREKLRPRECREKGDVEQRRKAVKRELEVDGNAKPDRSALNHREQFAEQKISYQEFLKA